MTRLAIMVFRKTQKLFINLEIKLDLLSIIK